MWGSWVTMHRSSPFVVHSTDIIPTFIIPFQYSNETRTWTYEYHLMLHKAKHRKKNLSKNEKAKKEKGTIDKQKMKRIKIEEQTSYSSLFNHKAGGRPLNPLPSGSQPFLRHPDPSSLLTSFTNLQIRDLPERHWLWFFWITDDEVNFCESLFHCCSLFTLALPFMYFSSELIYKQ